MTCPRGAICARPLILLARWQSTRPVAAPKRRIGENRRPSPIPRATSTVWLWQLPGLLERLAHRATVVGTLGDDVGPWLRTSRATPLVGGPGLVRPDADEAPPERHAHVEAVFRQLLVANS